MEQNDLVARATAAGKNSAAAPQGSNDAAVQGSIPGMEDLAARIEASSKAKSATTEASPGVVAGASAAVAATAAEVQGGQPEINPPGEAQATPSPEEPAAAAQGMPELTKGMPAVEVASRALKLAGEGLRLDMAAQVSSGIAAARIYNHSNPSYADDVGTLSLEVADAIIKAAAK